MSSARSGDTDVTEIIGAESSAVTRRVAPGRSIGRYLVISELGRGGMGLVLRAYDPKLQREVALKLLQIDALSDDARARLIREARAMAQLSHPNVVAIYDVELGSAASAREVMLAMEYVPGQTLRKWCETDRSWDAIVQVFTLAGRGLVAAHVRGLLHRDFKPDNVLVTPPADGTRDVPTVKVGDFGLATVAGQTRTPTTGDATEASSISDGLTEEGTVMGTPRYMAPEQHLAAELTGAADQYGFCLALWEALCGSYPFATRELVHQKLAGPPSWPRHACVPRYVADAVRRGLQPKPEDRWPDLATLLETLAPREPRRRGWTVGLGSVALAGLGTSLWLTQGTEASLACSGAADRLASVWDEQRRVALHDAMVGQGPAWAKPVFEGVASRLDAYREEWIEHHSDACEATTVRAEQSAAAMDLRMACLERARTNLAAVVRVLEASDPEVLQHAFDIVEELPPLHRCADLEALEADVAAPPPEQEDRIVAVREALASARALRDAGRYDASTTEIDRAAKRAEASSYDPIFTEIALERGLTLDRDGQWDEARQRLDEAAERGARLGQWELVTEATTKLVMVVGERMARPHEGLVYADYARGLVERLRREDLRVRLRANVAIVRHLSGLHEQALDEFRELLAYWETVPNADPLEVAGAHNNLGLALGKEGFHDEAVEHFEIAVAGFEQVLGPGHPIVGNTRSNLAMSLDEVGRADEAAAQFSRVLEIFIAALGPEHESTLNTRDLRATSLAMRGEAQRAEREYRAVIEARSATLPQDHPKLYFTHANLAGALADQGKFEEAQREIELALSLVMRSQGVEHPDYAGFLFNLAHIHAEQGRFAEAERAYREGLRRMQEAMGPDDLAVGRMTTSLGRFLLDRGKHREAVEHLERAWSLARDERVRPAEQAFVAFTLARALSKTTADEGRIGSLARTAHEKAESDPELLAEIEAWLEARR